MRMVWLHVPSNALPLLHPLTSILMPKEEKSTSTASKLQARAPEQFIGWEIFGLNRFRSMRDLVTAWCAAEKSFDADTSDGVLLTLKNAGIESTLAIPIFAPVLSVIIRIVVGVLVYRVVKVAEPPLTA